MPKMLYNTPILKTDAYKISHHKLYPKDLTKIYSVLIPRKNSYFPWNDHMVVFGYQMFVEKMFADWNANFFDQPLEDVLYTYKRTIGSILGPDNADISHIYDLHELGYLPIEIKALPEGTLVPMGVPVLTITNTDPRFAWLPNFLETNLLAETFVTSTVATTAHEFRKIATKYAEKSSDNGGYIDYQFHDFSQRGQHGNEAAVLSGLSHLTSFKGTDVLQAPMAAEDYYNPEDYTRNQFGGDSLSIAGKLGASVLASEHSVMEAYGLDQYKTYDALISDNPNGILSLVSDTYDYWEVIDKVLPALKDKIMARNGKVVIRPDSLEDVDAGLVKTLEHLWDTFGGTTNSKGYKVLDPHIGLLHGEGVTLDNVSALFDAILDAGFSAENIVLGVGAYVYSVNVSRDSFAQAIKAQVACFKDGIEKLIYKDPKTDTSHLKRSLKGAVVVLQGEDGELYVKDQLTLEQAENADDDWLQTIFREGLTWHESSFTDIRLKLQNDINQGK